MPRLKARPEDDLFLDWRKLCQEIRWLFPSGRPRLAQELYPLLQRIHRRLEVERVPSTKPSCAPKGFGDWHRRPPRHPIMGHVISRDLARRLGIEPRHPPVDLETGKRLTRETMVKRYRALEETPA